MTPEAANQLRTFLDASDLALFLLGISTALVGIGVWQLVQAMRNFKPHHGETP